MMAIWLSGSFSGQGPAGSREQGNPLIVQFVAVSHDSERPVERAGSAEVPTVQADEPSLPLSPPDAPEPDAAAYVEPVPTARPEAAAETELASTPSSELVADASTADMASASTGEDDDLSERYQAAVRARIESVWLSLTDRGLPNDCRLRISLAPGGGLVSASAASCSLDDSDRNQLEAAALMAQPMPYAGFEAVFRPELELGM